MPSEDITVLVVEDDGPTREVLQDLLEAAGYQVEAAADGVAALARFLAGGIDIVLLDQLLSRLHGLQLCERLRATRSDTYLPIIMMTALTGDSFRRAAKGAGADVYLTKPQIAEELLYVVGRWADNCARLKRAREGIGHSG